MDTFGTTAQDDVLFGPEYQTTDVKSYVADSTEEGYWDYSAHPPAWRKRSTGQFSSPPAKIIPITQKELTPMTDLNPIDAHAASRFLASLSEWVVQGSTLPAKLAELERVINELKADVEMYRENNARLDEEVSRLRSERADLQRENGMVRQELTDERAAHSVTADRLSATQRDSEHWQTSFIQISTELDTTRRARDEAEHSILELEEKLKWVTQERDLAQDRANMFGERLTNIRRAMESTVVPQAAANFVSPPNAA